MNAATPAYNRTPLHPVPNTNSKRPYSKPVKSPQDLILHLKSRGVTFTQITEKEAENVISKINYYRFKSYLRPYLSRSNNKQYQLNTDFFYGLKLYEFDHELRALCNKYLLKIELKLKSQLDRVMSEEKNDPFWYLSNDNFYQNVDHVRSKIKQSIRQTNRDSPISYYSNTYCANSKYYNEFPPFWIVEEVITFGNLVDLIKSIDKGQFKAPQRQHPLDDLAKKFGAKNWKALCSWLPLIKEIRNCCSHSNRTWNRNYRLPSGLTSELQTQPTMSNKIYLGLLVIHKMTQHCIIDKNNKFKDELEFLLSKYNMINQLEYKMGMPSSWKQESAWSI